MCALPRRDLAAECLCSMPQPGEPWEDLSVSELLSLSPCEATCLTDVRGPGPGPSPTQQRKNSNDNNLTDLGPMPPQFSGTLKAWDCGVIPRGREEALMMTVGAFIIR